MRLSWRSLPVEALATSFEISVADEEVDLGSLHAYFSEVTGEVLDYGDRAVPTSGASYPQGKVRFPLGSVTRYEKGEEVVEAGEKRFRIVLAKHGPADTLVVAGQRTKLGVVMGVREKADVEEHIHVQRSPVLEAEGY
jgi:hypothetical protein